MKVKESGSIELPSSSKWRQDIQKNDNNINDTLEKKAERHMAARMKCHV
jgi:hypothetical protein